jgi:hypothetical protein
VVSSTMTSGSRTIEIVSNSTGNSASHFYNGDSGRGGSVDNRALKEERRDMEKTPLREIKVFTLEGFTARVLARDWSLACSMLLYFERASGRRGPSRGIDIGYSTTSGRIPCWF